MKYYLKLQFTLLNRHIRAFGLPPWAGFFLGLLGFLGLSFYLFKRVDFAEYVYVAVALFLVLQHGNARRNGFLKTCYTPLAYRRIRLVENGLIALPFIAFLAFKQCFFGMGILATGAIIAFWIDVSRNFQLWLPTPFSRTPFEFLVGFRASILLILLAYFLTVMAWKVDNFNLGLFSLLLVFLLSLGYYGKPEDRFYVWIYKVGPKAFLRHKLQTALWHSSILAAPITLSLLVFYPENLWIILAVQLLGYLYLSCMVLAKYLNFPHQINLAQSIVIGISFTFPPLLLALIPFYYTKSLQKLKEVLA